MWVSTHGISPGIEFSQHDANIAAMSRGNAGITAAGSPVRVLLHGQPCTFIVSLLTRLLHMRTPMVAQSIASYVMCVAR